MTSYTPSRKREETRLRCTLLDASREGFRKPRKPVRYNADDYLTAKKRTQKKRRNAAIDSNKNIETTETWATKTNQRGVSTNLSEDGAPPSTATRSEPDRLCLSEDDIPTSPMRDGENEQNTTSSPYHQPESQQTHEREFLVRDLGSWDAQNRRTVGPDYVSTPLRPPTPVLPSDIGAASGTVWQCIHTNVPDVNVLSNLDQNANLSALPSPIAPGSIPQTTQLTASLGNPLLAAYTQQANAALLACLQHNAATPAMLNNVILPTANVQTFASQAQLANMGQAMSPLVQPLLNSNHSPNCVANTLAAVYNHLSLAAISMARIISLPSCGCGHSVDRGGRASSSNSSTTIPAYASGSYEHTDVSSSSTSQNLPRSNPFYGPFF